MGLLHLAARFGRLLLVLGLIAGFALPQAAATLRPWLGELVAMLLVITAFRVGPRAAMGGLTELPRSLLIICLLQLAAPLIALLLFSSMGILTSPFALAVVLMLAAPSVSASPNFAAMNGHDPAPAMRLLVLGTALFPITALPVLWLLPGVAEASETLTIALRLVLVVLGAVSFGFLLRHILLPDMSKDAQRSVDGLAVIALAVVVVGLMTEIGPLVRDNPYRLVLWLGGVMAVNLGLQLLVFLALNYAGVRDVVAISIISGNRNIALFLVALPAATMDPLLIFIGCYQVPMYLTPLLFRRLHNRAHS